MAEKVSIVCPECAKQFPAPEEIVGRKIRCKNCSKVFIAKKAKDVTLSKKKAEPDTGIIPFKDDDDEGDGKPYEVTSIDLAPRCPSCANELESEEDKVCLVCGFNLETRTATETKRIKEASGGDIFWWLFPGILAAVYFFMQLGVCISQLVWRLAWIPEDPTDRLTINFVNGVTLWQCLLSVWLMYLSGKFAIKRLIFDNKPPEQEL